MKSIKVKRIEMNPWLSPNVITKQVELFPLSHDMFYFMDYAYYQKYMHPKFNNVENIKRIGRNNLALEEFTFQGFEKQLIKYFKDDFLYYENGEYNMYVNKNKVLSIEKEKECTIFNFENAAEVVRNAVQKDIQGESNE